MGRFWTMSQGMTRGRPVGRSGPRNQEAYGFQEKSLALAALWAFLTDSTREPPTASEAMSLPWKTAER